MIGEVRGSQEKDERGHFIPRWCTPNFYPFFSLNYIQNFSFLAAKDECLYGFYPFQI
jgi:hypothetical protein